MHNFKEISEEYLLFASKQQKKQSFESLGRRFSSKILPYFESWNIEDITIQDYIKWQNVILKFNYSNNYNRNLHFIFSGFLHYCCLYHNLDKNVASQVGSFKKKYEEKKTDFYNLKEFNQFIKHIENNIYKQFFNFLFYTGTRPGEAMALRFSDLENEYISITKTIDSHGNRYIGTPKTTSSIRKIKIDNQLQKDLLEIKKYYVDKHNYYFDYYIFGGIKPLSPTTVNRYKIKACEHAGIRPITLHQFRHSHATLFLNNNIMINEISRRLGHSKVSTTLDVYTHTDLEQEKRVSDTLNSLRYNFFKSLGRRFNKIISNITTFL